MSIQPAHGGGLWTPAWGRTIRAGRRFLALPLYGVLGLILLSCQSGPTPLPGTDWADVTLYATGVGPLDDGSFGARVRAVQQAKHDVARQLETRMLGLRTDSGKTVLERSSKKDHREKVAAYARRAEILSMANTAGQVHLHARLFLGDPFKSALGFLPYKDPTSQPLHSHGAP